MTKTIKIAGLILLSTISAGSILLTAPVSAQTVPDTTLNSNPSLNTAVPSSLTRSRTFTTTKCTFNKDQRLNRINYNLNRFNNRMNKIYSNLQKFVDKAKLMGKDTSSLEANILTLKTKAENAVSTHQALASVLTQKDCSSLESSQTSERNITASRENAIGSYDAVTDYLRDAIRLDVKNIRNSSVNK